VGVAGAGADAAEAEPRIVDGERINKAMARSAATGKGRERRVFMEKKMRVFTETLSRKRVFHQRDGEFLSDKFFDDPSPVAALESLAMRAST
jgi:hypothetical protein